MDVYKIKFGNVQRVFDWLAAVSDLDADFNIDCGNTYVDGKSVMGLMTLDFTRVCTLEVISDIKIRDLVKDIITRLDILI